jgi:hypothetical protein
MTITNHGYKGPLPSSDFRTQLADEVMPPFTDVISGEIYATVNRPLGIARYKGRIKRVIFSVAGLAGGSTKANIPRISGEVYINKTKALSTPASIGHTSGETLQFKTTDSESEDTPVIQPVINESTNTFSPGDLLSWTLLYSGGGTSDAKAQSPAILVEVEPIEG